jgi:hypothetical protein
MDQYSGGLVSIEWHPARATLRSFGLALALLCIGRGVWSWTNSGPAAALIAVGLMLAAVAHWRPSTLHKPYVLLGVLSFPLRWLLSFCVLAVVYFALITPIAYGVRLARRFSGRDTNQTNWRVPAARGDKPSYFRQF